MNEEPGFLKHRIGKNSDNSSLSVWVLPRPIHVRETHDQRRDRIQPFIRFYVSFSREFRNPIRRNGIGTMGFWSRDLCGVSVHFSSARGENDLLNVVFPT